MIPPTVSDKIWNDDGPPDLPPSCSYKPVKWGAGPSSSSLSKTLGSGASETQTPFTTALPLGISSTCSPCTVAGSSVLTLFPCSPPCICGGHKIPVSPNLSTYLTTHKRKPLAPLCLSWATCLPQWPPPPFSQLTCFPTTAHNGTVLSHLSRLGPLGNLSLFPYIV